MQTKHQVMKDGVVLTTRIFEANGRAHRGVAVATNSQAQHILNLAPTLSGLAEHGWKVHGVDLRGHGKSTSERAPLAHMQIEVGWELLISDFKTTLEVAFDGVPWDERMVVVPNIGGPLLLEVLKEWPDLARRLVMIAPPTNQRILNRLARSFMKARLLLNPADAPDELTMHQMYSFLSAQLEDRKRLIDVVSSDRELTDMLLDDEFAWPTPTTGYFYEMFRGIEQAWKLPPHHLLKTGTELLVLYGSDDPMTASGKFVKTIASHFEKMGLTNFSSHCIEGGRSGLFVEEARFNISGHIAQWATGERGKSPAQFSAQKDEELARISSGVLESLGVHEYDGELAPDALVELCYHAINDENRWIEMLYRVAFALSGDKSPSDAQLETLVGALMPHWDRSYKLNRQILNNAAVGAVLQNVIDRFEIGLAILDADFNIAYANPAFSRALYVLGAEPPMADDGLENVGLDNVELDNVELDNEKLTSKLAPYLSPAFRSRAESRDGEAVMVVDDTIVGFYFKPSALKQTALTRGGAAGALILRGVVRGKQEDAQSQQQLLEFAYGMTPKEAEVAMWVIEGKSPADISEQLDVSINTIRTHLKRVFEKAAVQGQTELIAKMLSGPFGLLQ